MAECKRGTSGGKGNLGMFIERDKRVCSAGLPTAQANLNVPDALQCYLLKDAVDSLISDAILPPPPKKSLLRVHKPPPRDQRFTCFDRYSASDLGELVNPTPKNKVDILIENFKETVYSSYWKKRLGRAPDNTPMFPRGFDIEGTTFGKKNAEAESLYDVAFPKDPVPDKTPASKHVAAQVCRNYCQPPYDPDLTYGHRSKIDKRGIYMKCCLTDDRVLLGTSNRTQFNSVLANHKNSAQAVIGKSAAPNNNINCVPEGHVFGTKFKTQIPGEFITDCLCNPEKESVRKSLSHLNTLRKNMSTRYLPTFFGKLYLELKYFDKEKTGWLPKDFVYDYCSKLFVILNPTLIEPLLTMWQAFDGNNINYEILCHILNFKQPLPTLPKIQDISPECLHFTTTYREMTKPCQERDGGLRAGLPSGRYMDMDYPVVSSVGLCRAHKTCLPDESDMPACLSPSVWTLLHVSHRDMYAKREPHVVRRVFEATGDKFTDESFNYVWEAAKKYHSQGWVCYETFRKALEESPYAPKIKIK